MSLGGRVFPWVLSSERLRCLEGDVLVLFLSSEERKKCVWVSMMVDDEEEHWFPWENFVVLVSKESHMG